MTVALITAAGKGTRMGQDIPKQFMHVDNKPILLYTLEAFQKHPSIDAIMIVTLPGWIEVLNAYTMQFNLSKVKWIIPGGTSGQESIYFGLRKLNEEIDADSTVMIHDGNRCFVSAEIISNSLAVYQQHGCAVAAIPCVEAVFRSEDNGVSSNISIPRSQLYRTQTPHTYSLKKLLWAYNTANEKGYENVVAACTLMQQLGEKIYFSKGSEQNLKITTVDDLIIFESLLHAKKDVWLK